MNDSFNFETLFNVDSNSLLKAAFDDSSLYDGGGKKYTIMKKKAFINYVESLISNFNMVGRSLLDSAKVPDVIKIIKMNYPPWLSNHQLDYDVDESHHCIYDYALNPDRSTRILPNNCLGMRDKKLDGDAVPENQGADLTISTPYKSVIVAVSQMAPFENDPVSESRMESWSSFRKLSQNEELKYYYPGRYDALCEGVMQVDYLKSTLDFAKNFDEDRYTFFIDDHLIPTIMSTTEFVSKYISGKNDETSLY